MSHARLTHPDRPTLELYRGQNDEAGRTATLSLANQLGTDSPTLVHTETREETRTVSGAVSAPKRAENDPNTNDWRQALANYADLLEASVDEFQGEGYTFEDDQLNVSKPAVLEAAEWSLSPGRIYELQYEATILIGNGAFESAGVTRQNPTIDDSLTTMIEVDGVACPGMRDYQVRREIGTETNAVFDRDSAENNDIVITDGAQRQLVFEGVHSGTKSARRTADDALKNLLALADPVTLDTYFPGYSIEGYVTTYNSTLEQQRGDTSHRYRLEFQEGRRA